MCTYKHWLSGGKYILSTDQYEIKVIWNIDKLTADAIGQNFISAANNFEGQTVSVAALNPIDFGGFFVNFKRSNLNWKCKNHEKTVEIQTVEMFYLPFVACQLMFYIILSFVFIV